MWPGVRDGAGDQPEQHCKDDVRQQVEREQEGEELRPGQRDGEMVRIAQVEARDAFFLDFVGAEAICVDLSPGRRRSLMRGSRRRCICALCRLRAGVARHSKG